MAGGAAPAELRRSVSLLQLSLYGIGTTVGAGIYVLVGAAAGYAGENVALGFLLAALIVAPSAATFAALARRLPLSAGEAAYVDAAFGRAWLSLAVGLAVATAGTVTAAALTRGAAGYVAAIVAAPEWLSMLVILAAMGGVAAWGVGQSVTLAAILTVIEVAGLGVIVSLGAPRMDAAFLAGALTPGPGGSWLPALGILQAAFLAFFAFIGFEDIVNLAEETEAPTRTVPAAIGVTLVVTALVYMAVSLAAVAVVPPAELGTSEAPLALVVERAIGGWAAGFAVIAVLATLNGILVQMIMGSRVLYGLARLGRLPAFVGRVDSRTRTPLAATAIVVTIICTVAFTVPLVRLAETTSAITLAVFTAVNLALLALRWRENPRASARLRGAAAPVLGAATSAGFLAAQLLRMAG